MSKYGDTLDAIARTPAPGGPALPYRIYSPPALVTYERKSSLDRWEVFVPPGRRQLARQRAPVSGAGVAIERYVSSGRHAAGPMLPASEDFFHLATERAPERLHCTSCGASPEWIVGNPNECITCSFLAITPQITTPQIGRAETVAELHDILDGGSFPFLVVIGTEHLLARPAFNVRPGALANARALALRGVCACVNTDPGCDRLYVYRAVPGASMSWREQWLLPEGPPAEPVPEPL